MDLIDSFRTFYPNAEYIFFSSAHVTFSRIEILGYKSSLGKFKKNETISTTFLDQNAMRLEINYRKIIQKTQTYGA